MAITPEDFKKYKWWGRPEKEVVLVNLTTLPIGPAELKTAFAVSENQLWWRAINQTLEVRRQECLDEAASAVNKNNPLMVAGMTMASKVLADTILDLQRLRKQSVSE